MSEEETPQQSLRRHRQTLLPPQKGQPPQVPVPGSKKPDYGALLGPNSAELPSVKQRDKEKVCTFDLLRQETI